MEQDRIQNNNQKGQKVMLSEDKIQRIIEASKESFLHAEEKRMLSYRSFLFIQLQIIQKRWWILQWMVLVALWLILSVTEDMTYIYRSMGVVSTIFIILIIPEIWKNRTNQSMEIESVTYYSLKQVYASRMLLFGIVDVGLVTAFCGIATVSLNISLTDLLIQFLLPMTVTACICFGILCNRHLLNESVAVGMCILWSALWWFALLDDRIYRKIAVSVWVLALGIAFSLLVFFIYQSIRQCTRVWEETLNGIETD